MNVIYFLQHPDPYVISNSSFPESVMLAYVQLYDIREHEAGLIEQGLLGVLIINY